MTEQRPLAAAILAGGNASRFGGINKGTLSVDGAEIVDRQLDALRQIASPVFIVGRDAAAWSARGLEVVGDEIPGMGPLGGIYTAIVRSPCDRVLVVACDMPFLSPTFLRRMTAVEDADLVIPRTARGFEPLCAIYSRACAADIRARLDRRELHASTLPHGIRIAELGPEIALHELLFVNLNTPHDYERAKGLIELEPTEDRITSSGRVPPLRRPRTTDS
jgi:molybdopterin-guanine dinucleotide biosynthesis protein A